MTNEEIYKYIVNLGFELGIEDAMITEPKTYKVFLQHIIVILSTVCSTVYFVNENYFSGSIYVIIAILWLYMIRHRTKWNKEIERRRGICIGVKSQKFVSQELKRLSNIDSGDEDIIDYTKTAIYIEYLNEYTKLQFAEFAKHTGNCIKTNRILNNNTLGAAIMKNGYNTIFGYINEYSWDMLNYLADKSLDLEEKHSKLKSALIDITNKIKGFDKYYFETPLSDHNKETEDGKILKEKVDNLLEELSLLSDNIDTLCWNNAVSNKFFKALKTFGEAYSKKYIER